MEEGHLIFSRSIPFPYIFHHNVFSLTWPLTLPNSPTTYYAMEGYPVMGKKRLHFPVYLLHQIAFKHYWLSFQYTISAVFWVCKIYLLCRWKSHAHCFSLKGIANPIRFISTCCPNYPLICPA